MPATIAMSAIRATIDEAGTWRRLRCAAYC